MNPDAPLALIGYAPEAARALRALGLLAIALPDGALNEVFAALRTLHFSGALIAPHLEEAAFVHVHSDAAARKLGRVDSVSLAGALHASHALEEALLRLVQDSAYAARGARMLLLGEGAPLRAAVGLARLGAPSVTVAAGHAGEAERALQLLPAGVKGYALALNDPALGALAERADLVVLTSGPLPPGVLQPFHTLLDLTAAHGHAALREGVARIEAGELPALRLSLQLEHATGQRFKPEVLREVAAGIG